MLETLLRQNEQLEDRLVDNVDTTRKEYQNHLGNMRRLDNREVFEKDDEVGVTFEEMKKIVEDSITNYNTPRKRRKNQKCISVHLLKKQLSNTTNVKTPKEKV